MLNARKQMIFFFKFERVSEWEVEKKGNIFHQLLCSPNNHNSRARPSLSQEHGTPACLPHGCRGPGPWAICCCFPRHVSTELDGNWGSWDVNKTPGLWMNTYWNLSRNAEEAQSLGLLTLPGEEARPAVISSMATWVWLWCSAIEKYLSLKYEFKVVR